MANLDVLGNISKHFMILHGAHFFQVFVTLVNLWQKRNFNIVSQSLLILVNIGIVVPSIYENVIIFEFLDEFHIFVNSMGIRLHL